MKRAMWQLAIGGLLLPCLALAQEDDPTRGVARISLIAGDVSVRRGDSGEWVAAAVNGPLVVEDSVLTGPDARTELQFDYATFLRLSGDTELRLADLQYKRYQAQLARGMVMLSVVRDNDAEMELDTPNVAIRPVKRGMVRVVVSPDGQTEVTVREGEVEVFSPRGSQRLHAGNTMLVRGDAGDPEFQIVRAAGFDNWDRWNEERDRRVEHARSYDYVSSDVYGAEDLDGYGRWVNVAPYGTVWAPAGLDSDWAPYRNGRWVWVDWYGWTWVSYDPWGWAPYHYGRWFYSMPYGWCWYPGGLHERYYWRPALVAFIGVGHGVGVGIGFGNVGWVPLAPYEPFYPWYGRRYYGGYRNGAVIHNDIYVQNNVNVVKVYRNARVANGVSGIEEGDFVRGRSARAIHVTEATLVRGPVPVAPVAESVRVSDRQVRTTAVTRIDNTRFVTRRPAPAIERVPFEQQRRGVEQNVQRTFAAPTVAPPAGGQENAVRQAEPARSWGGWRRVGETPAVTAQPAPPEQPRVRETAPRQENTWQRFPTRNTEVSPAPRQENRTVAPPERAIERTMPRQENRTVAQPRQETQRYERPQPIRVNPPMVRERIEPRQESRPAVTRTEAPQRSSGGGSARSGGGESRGSSGGGGGKQSSGSSGRSR